MDNVNDLIHTNSSNQQPISLSAITNNESRVAINTTNGLSGVADNHESVNKPIVKVNPNRGRNRRRTIEDGKDFKSMEVDPSSIIPQQERPRAVSPRDIAISQLDMAVARKRQEFSDFIENATKDDQINRERVEAGIDTVNGEMQYMPDPLHIPMSEEEKIDHNTNTGDDESDFFTDESNNYTTEDPNSFNKIVMNDNPFDYNDNYGENIANEEENKDDTSNNEYYENSNYQDKETDQYTDDVESDIEKEINSDTFENISNNIDDSKDDTAASDESEIAEENIKNEFDISEGSIEMRSSVLNETVQDVSSSDFDIAESDLDGVNVASLDDGLTEEQVIEISNASEKHLRSEILQKIIQSGKKINMSQFVVSNKVVNIKDAVNAVGNTVVRTATWPLTFAGRPFIATALKGPEVALMYDADELADTGAALNTTQARIMFEHDANPYRPSTLEAWAKTIPYADVENIFAALYCASLKGSNYIPMACGKRSCQYAYLTDNIDIDDMIKFSTDEAKERFDKIKHMELTPENTGAYDTVVSVINNKFAVGLKLPSIFTVLYEYNTLNQEFVNKYTSIVSIMQYIDYIYLIDENTNQLSPIGWKSYTGDHTKTFKSKIATYAKILKELDATDFGILLALINSMVTKARESKDINYEIPASKCPKCGTEIEARPIDARGLVFMRQRLVELATSPIAR